MLLFLFPVREVMAQHWSYNGSMQVAVGSYVFGERTRSFYFTNGVGVSCRQLDLAVSFPYAIQNSPWISYSGAGRLPTGGPQNGLVGQQSGRRSGSDSMKNKRQRHLELPDTATYTQAGFSDPTLTAGYRLLASKTYTSMWYLNASLKFPFTGPARGFGTGAWDFGIGSSFTQRLGPWFLMGNLMYWRFGDMPDLELQNSWGYGLAIARMIAQERWRVTVSFTGMTEIIEGIAPSQSIGLALGHRVGERTELGVQAYLGLSESSSDVAFGVDWNIRLN